MFILANFLNAVAGVLDMLLWLFMLLVIARAVISWVSPDPRNPIVRFLYAVTEPLLYQVRRRLPVYYGGIDFSPVVVIAAIYFLDAFLVASLRDLAFRLRAF